MVPFLWFWTSLLDIVQDILFIDSQLMWHGIGQRCTMHSDMVFEATLICKLTGT
jgi:hypothetical protein